MMGCILEDLKDNGVNDNFIYHVVDPSMGVEIIVKK